MFVKDGQINRNLFEMSSRSIKVENIPSFHTKKYIYPKGNACLNQMNLLFSTQSTLTYTEKTKSNYKNFYSILQNEKMNLGDFDEYQKSEIIWLSQRGCVKINEENALSLHFGKVRILKDLFYNQVSCFLYLDRFSTILNYMELSEEIQYMSSLFSKPEQDYINYILNKAEFSNGKDLRNKYVHGTHSLQTSDHEADYIELLKIIVLIVIKINEEFCFLKSQKEPLEEIQIC